MEPNWNPESDILFLGSSLLMFLATVLCVGPMKGPFFTWENNIGEFVSPRSSPVTFCRRCRETITEWQTHTFRRMLPLEDLSRALEAEVSVMCLGWEKYFENCRDSANVILIIEYWGVCYCEKI